MLRALKTYNVTVRYIKYVVILIFFLKEVVTLSYHQVYSQILSFFNNMATYSTLKNYTKAHMKFDLASSWSANLNWTNSSSVLINSFLPKSSRTNLVKDSPLPLYPIGHAATTTKSSDAAQRNSEVTKIMRR